MTEINADDLVRLVSGYTSNELFRVSRTETDGNFTLKLELTESAGPYHKRFNPEQDLEHYLKLPELGFSFGAFENELLVGLALAEPRQWNRSLMVWELHVAEDHRGCGIGRMLVDSLSGRAAEAGLRTLVAETQNTNLPAIRFYRSVGFRIEGIDLSLYSNADFPDGEIALFMKKIIG